MQCAVGLAPTANAMKEIPTWSGRRDSDSRPQPWQGCALPTELLPHVVPWGGIEPPTRRFSVYCSTD